MNVSSIVYILLNIAKQKACVFGGKNGKFKKNGMEREGNRRFYKNLYGDKTKREKK